MKKIIFILAFALPFLSLGQRGNMEIQSKENRVENNNEIEVSYVYMQLLVLSKGKEEQVIIQMDEESMKSTRDPRAMKQFELIREKEFPSLVRALTELNQFGWEYVDSFDVTTKDQAMIKVILRKRIVKEKKR